ncbi:MAG: hypothetical protein KGI54_10505 [Pseudomonadota bacterium]|nr:hypothetical protein [Pseudomonadota bacterium]
MKFINVLVKRSRLNGKPYTYKICPTNLLRVGEKRVAKLTSKKFIGSGEDVFV